MTRTREKCAILWLIQFIMLLKDCGCLKMIELLGPEMARSGEIVTFTCRYDLGQAAIYSLKWYKEDQEIYRYIPTDNPEYRIFRGSPGVIVMKNLTLPNRLVVKMDGPFGSGIYRCELTIETPLFVTKDISKNMTVIVPPTTKPRIIGMKQTYQIGDKVEVSCKSMNSKPAPSIRWLVNKRNVTSSMTLPVKTKINQETRLESTISTIRFIAEEKHFRDRNLYITCIASISDVWQAQADDAAVGILGNVTQQTNQIVIGASPSLSNSPPASTTTLLTLLYKQIPLCGSISFIVSMFVNSL